MSCCQNKWKIWGLFLVFKNWYTLCYPGFGVHAGILYMYIYIPIFLWQIYSGFAMRMRCLSVLLSSTGRRHSFRFMLFQSSVPWRLLEAQLRYPPNSHFATWLLSTLACCRETVYSFPLFRVMDVQGSPLLGVLLLLQKLLESMQAVQLLSWCIHPWQCSQLVKSR